MSLKKEIEHYLVLVQSLEASLQIAMESKSIPNGFFDATHDLLDVLKEELGELETLYNQGESFPENEMDKFVEIVQEPVGKIYPDIRQMLSINDFFRFQRELFEGNKQQMDDTLDYLNSFRSIDETLLCLKSRFDWDWETESVGMFMEVLEKRFTEV